jgi:hypothetical protein
VVTPNVDLLHQLVIARGSNVSSVGEIGEGNLLLTPVTVPVSINPLRADILISHWDIGAARKRGL